jgi:hypothetical protein
MEKTTARKSSASFIGAVILTALIAGVLDMLGAIISYTAAGGKKPIVIFQYITSAIFGKSAFDGSTSMMIAGLLFHFVIAFIFTLFFFLIFPKIKLLQGNTLLAAIVYGIFVWAVMNKIVIPYFTKLDPVIFDLKKASIAAFILIVCIGLPVVIAVKKYYRELT